MYKSSMNMLNKTTFFSLLILFVAPLTGMAQTKVTFNINLIPMMEDSTYVPERDIVRVTANQFPLGTNRFANMKATADNDSLFTVEVSFSRRLNGQQLKYNFEVVTPNKTFKESAPRVIILRGEPIETPALYFDDFAI